MLCYTTTPNQWKSFTRDGRCKGFVALRKGWENEPCVEGENYPKDSYGLSIIAFFVNEFGVLTNSNVRWNHGHRTYRNKIDQIFTQSELELLLGGTLTELTGIMSCEDALSQGVDPHNIFDNVKDIDPKNGVYAVLRGEQWKLLANNNLLGEWFNQIELVKTIKVQGAVAIVDKDGKKNLIDGNGKYLFDNWMTSIYAPIMNVDKYTILSIGRRSCVIDNQTRQNLLPGWFDVVDDIGIPNVYQVGSFIHNENSNQEQGKYSLVLLGKGFLTNNWYDGFEKFVGGYANCAKVKLNGKYNYINPNGEIIQPDYWFSEASDFFPAGYAIVRVDDGYNFIRPDGTFILEKPESDTNQLLTNLVMTLISQGLSYDHIFSLVRGGDESSNYIMTVEMINCFNNFIDSNGHLLLGTWHNYAGIFKDGYGYFADTLGEFNNGLGYRVDVNGNVSQIQKNESVMMKKKMTLTESQLSRIIRRCINETLRG